MGFSVQGLLDALMQMPGYGGSGFRSKEVLPDVIENCRGIVGEQAWLQVWLAYWAVVVVGVGPVCTINCFFNRPFFWMCNKRPAELNIVYKPAILYVATWLQGYPALRRA